MRRTVLERTTGLEPATFGLGSSLSSSASLERRIWQAGSAATIAALGDRDPAYLTHREIDAALPLAPAGVEARWVATDSEEARRIDSFDALWVLPGTPCRDDDVVYAAIRFAREGLAGARDVRRFQYMAVEFARNVAGIRGAAMRRPTRTARRSSLDSCRAASLVRSAGSPRCGDARLAALCGTAPFIGFHWCSYGLADGVAERLAAAGLVMSAHARDAGVEASRPGHPTCDTCFSPR